MRVPLREHWLTDRDQPLIATVAAGVLKLRRQVGKKPAKPVEWLRGFARKSIRDFPGDRPRPLPVTGPLDCDIVQPKFTPARIPSCQLEP